MKNINFRVLSLLLAVAMIFSILPLSIFAEEINSSESNGAQTSYTEWEGEIDVDKVADVNGIEYESLQAAVDAAMTGDTITLLRNSIGGGIEIPADKDLTLDLAGYTYICNLNSADNSIAMAINVYSKTTIKNGTIITYNGCGGIQAAYETAEVTLEDLTVDVNGINAEAEWNSSAVNAAAKATIIINSGTYSSEQSAAVIVKTTGGNVTINGGTFTTDCTSDVSGAVRIDGWSAQDRRLTINGGTFNAASDSSFALRSAGVVTTVVNGGTFNGAVSAQYSDVIITGGIFNKTILQGQGHTDKYVISGGTFVDDPTSFLASDSEVVDNGDGTWIVFCSTGTITIGYTANQNGYVKVWGETANNATESIVIKLYCGETLIATTTLVEVTPILDGDNYVTFNFYLDAETMAADGYWNTVWEEGHPNSAAQPDKVVLYVDGTEVAYNEVQMNGPDNLNSVKWRELGGVVIADLEGSGTAEDPYIISNLEELEWFRDDVNGGNTYNGKYIKVVVDGENVIDLASAEWTPIGYNGATFKGNFNGNGVTIKNLVITKTLTNSSENNNIGFFGRTDSPAVIQNLNIENVDITGSLHVGAIVGLGYTGNKIENCKVSGDIAIDAWWYAGVIGGYGYMSLVNECYVIGNDGSYIKGNNGSYIGGIWGFRGEGSQQITNCSVTNLSITGVDRVGGISGIAHYGNKVSDVSVSDVTVTATDADAKTVGLIVGACQGTAENPSIFTSVTVEDVTVKVGDTDVTDSIGIYGTTIGGDAAVTNLVAKVNGVIYPSLQKAIDAANDGDTITVIGNVSDETVTVNKSVTITADANNKPVLNNVRLTISGTNVELTVSNLKFTGDSYINANDGKALTVTGVEATVTPTKITGRAAFIVIGTGEPTHGLLLTVKDNKIIVTKGDNAYGDPYAAAIFGWRYLANGTTISGNVFGSEDAPFRFIAVKTMNAMDGAIITIDGNTVYGTNVYWKFKAFDLYQNCSRDNNYTVVSKNNTFFIDETGSYSVCAFYLEGNGGTNVILTDNGSTVNGEALTMDYVDATGVPAGYDKYYGINVELNDDGEIIGGTFGGNTADITVAAVASVSDGTYTTYYTSLAAAVDAANDGDTITVIGNVSDETVTVNKSVTITADANNKPVLNNVRLTISGTNVELTVSNLKFTGDSYINANDGKALTVTGVEATVTPTKITGRAAFIVIGTGEPTHGLLLTVKDNKIIVTKGDNAYGDPYAAAIFGWRYLANGTTISGNVFGSEDAPFRFIAVKTMNAMDGAIITIDGNTVYGTNVYWKFKAFDLYQNCSRDNNYTVVSKNNTFFIDETGSYSVCAFYLEGNGGTNVILTDNGSTVNGEALTMDYVDATGVPAGYDKYYGINVELNDDGEIIGGTFVGNTAHITVAAVAYVSDGTYTTYYISLADALKAAKRGETVTLLEDIDLSGVEWTPVDFVANLDGNGKTISNLTVCGEKNVGLLATATGNGWIKNLTIKNVTASGKANVSALVGSTINRYVFTDCDVIGTINITGNYKVGGLVGGGYFSAVDCDVIGDENSDSKIIGEYLEPELEGDCVGGLVGFIGEGNYDAIVNCTVSNVTVVGTRKVGGMVGSAFQDNNINGSVSNVKVGTNADAEYAEDNAKTMGVGGLVGLYTANGNNGGEISGTVNGVILDTNDLEGVSAGYITGGLRGTETPVAPAATVEASISVEGANSGATTYYMYAAKIGENYYTTIQDAINEAQNGDTIVLLKDIEISEQIKISKGITIDGNGHTIKATAAILMFYRVSYAGGTLTFKNITLDGNNIAKKIFQNDGGAGKTVFDTATVTGANGSYGTGIHISGGNSTAEIINSTVTGNNGSYSIEDGYGYAMDLWVGNGNVKVTVENSVIGSVFVNAASSNSGTLYVSGDETTIDYLCGENANTNSVIEISGGRIKTIVDRGTYKISGGTFESAIGAELCAEGYLLAKNNTDGTYTVVENTYFRFLGGSLRYSDATDGKANIRFGYDFADDFDLEASGWGWEFQLEGYALNNVTGNKYIVGENITNLVLTGVRLTDYATDINVTIYFTVEIDGITYTVYDRVQTRTILGVAQAIAADPFESDDSKIYAQSVIDAYNAQ